jgi:hypothetical protein
MCVPNDEARDGTFNGRTACVRRIVSGAQTGAREGKALQVDKSVKVSKTVSGRLERQA